MRKLLFAAATAAMALVLLPVSSASAALLATTNNCDNGPISNPFAPWGDNADYVLAPDGAFENGTGQWELAGGSAVVNGNSPLYAHGAGDSHSLLVKKGTTATSATMCIGQEHPTVRFFAQNVTGSVTSALEVRVSVETLLGREFSLPVGWERGNTNWEPSSSMRLIVNYLNLRPGAYTPVEFEFYARNGDWRVDDVYVDPRRN
jgi:hypothetical protein